MSVPGIVESRLGDEDVATQISLSGGDEVFVTPTRTLVYRAEGLLSDESVEEFDHDAERLSVSEGRRKSTITFEYAVEDDGELALPTSRLDDVVRPVLAGVLRSRGVTDADERIVQTFRFSELTLVITSERLLKHVGSAVWDQEYESYHFEDVLGVDYEEGSVATQVVLRVGDRTQRIKTPNDQFPAVQRDLESGLLSYRNVSSVEELSPESDEDEDDEDDEADDDATDAVTSLGNEGIDPLSTGDTVDVEADPLVEPGSDEGADDGAGQVTEESDADDGDASDSTGGADDGDESAADEDSAETDSGEPEDGTAPDVEDADEAVIEEWESPPDESDGSFGGAFEPATGSESGTLAEELSELRAAVEHQNELLADQQETIRQLVEALREREASREE